VSEKDYSEFLAVTPLRSAGGTITENQMKV
jgi:hypothetical protein